MNLTVVDGSATFAQVQHRPRRHQAGQHLGERDEIDAQVVRLRFRRARRRK